MQTAPVGLASRWNARGGAAAMSSVAVLQEVSDESRLVVSEPLGDLAGAWNEVPESSYGVIQPGDDALLPFTPGVPASR